MLLRLRDKVLEGKELTKEDVSELIAIDRLSLFELFSASNTIREHYRKDRVDLCSIVNAKSGGCSEDCAYCAQSSRSKAAIHFYPLIEVAEVIDVAMDAKISGARRFCIVTGGRKPLKKEMEKVANMISEIKRIGLLPCATLGLLNEEDLKVLKDAGLVRYHHNLETSERFFPEVCTTHTFREKIHTIKAVKKLELSLCSGGIFGLGETWDDRIEMAFQLRELDVDSVPINFIIPIEGTGMGRQNTLQALEALKIISIYRFIFPDKEIRICGGRLQTLGELNPFIFMAGADGLLVGNYLTTQGRPPDKDLKLIENLGLRYQY